MNLFLKNASGASFGETMLKDVRFGARQLWRNPGFTSITVLTLALGIGATSSVFSLIHGVLLTPPPYPKPERIMLIQPVRVDGRPYLRGPTTEQWTEWQKASRSFEVMTGYDWTFDYLLLQDGGEAVSGLEVTSDYFKVIGTKPFLGRTFLESESPVNPQLATFIILGYDLWQRKFHGDPHILGQKVRLSRHEPLTVVGVMPVGVRFLPSFGEEMNPNYDVNARVDYWLPVMPDLSKPKEAEGSGNGPWSVAGRLRSDVTPAQAQVELSAIAARQAQADHFYQGISAKVQRLTEFLNHDGRKLLLPLLAAVTFVFLIACGNVAGLMLARGLQRQPEYALRCGLGAQRVRLFRQVIAESLLIAVLGGALGVMLAVAIVKVLKATGGFAIPRLDSVPVGGPVLVFCFVSAVVAAALSGLLPALRASRLDPAQAIKGSAPVFSATRTERGLLGGVAILQTALTLALLVGAGMLIRTVINLARLRPGFDTQNILTMSVMTDFAKIHDDFHQLALERVSALPGVKNAAFVWGLPLTGNKWVNDGIKITGQPDEMRLTDKSPVSVFSVTPGYFDALGLKILEGHGFRPGDSSTGWKNAFEPVAGETPCVCIINQAMADKFFPGSSPIGRKLDAWPWPKRSKEIIGVVANSRTQELTQNAQPEVYFPFFQFYVFTKHLIVRTSSDPGSLASAVQRELRAIDPTVAVDHIKTFDQIRAESVASQTFAMRLLVGFSLTGSFLALVGIYGVLSLSVGSRKREMAIRLALGAQRRTILALILSEGLKLIVLGLVIGTCVAIASTRLLGALLFGVGPNDPITFVAVAILFAAVALLACLLPALRATRVDPMTALRHE
jgi:putative ABC transport system permease protein